MPNPNTKQKGILIAVAIIIGAMLLFPPFYAERRVGGSTSYTWLFTADTEGRVDVGLLFTQFFVLGVIGLVAFVLSDDRARAKPGKDSDRAKGPGPAPAESEAVRTKRRVLGYGDEPPQA